MSQSFTSSSERESARMVCSRLQQVHRAFRLYPAAHPTAHRVLVDFAEELTRHLASHGSLVLRVEESALLFEDHEVYFQEEMRTSLAFLMFRDGLRFLTFHPGMAEEEAEAFVDCLAHSDDLASMEHDLATALWERDLQHLEYEVADSFLGGGGHALRDEAANDLRSTVLRRLGELNPGSSGAGSVAGSAQAGGSDDQAGGSEAQGSPAAPESVEPEMVMVTEADIQSGEHAVAAPDDVFGDFAVVLLEIAGFPEPPAEHDLLAHSLALVAERYFELCDAEGLGLMVDRLVSLEHQGRRPPEYAAGIFSEVASSECLAQYIGSLDQAPAVKLRDAEALLCKMRDWILPSLLELLAESSDKGVRKIALDVLEMEGGVPTEHLWPLMQDPRWYVVRNAVSLATGSEHPQLLDRLEPLLRHPDARVRREVMRSADAVTGPRSAMLFARALSDDDLSVRVLAANGLGRHGSRTNVPVLEAHIDSRDFATRPAEEINAVLTAFASLGGDTTVEMLNKIWRRKVFGTKPLPVRLGAIQALGAVATPSAREALQEAASSGESQIQRVAARAMAEIRARTKGERP